MDWPKLPDLNGKEISFHSEYPSFSFENERQTSDWIVKVIEEEKKGYSTLNIIFCNDAQLLEKNLEYLNHDTLTDIITFQYNSEPLEGDIFISIERVKANAIKLNVEFQEELNRVIIHGVLHLCGYGDKNVEEKKQMREKEDYYLRRC